MITYSGFTYSELVKEALSGKNREAEKLWHCVMRSIQARRDAENQCIKEIRPKHPGLSRDEILAKCADWLNKNYPNAGH